MSQSVPINLIWVLLVDSAAKNSLKLVLRDSFGQTLNKKVKSEKMQNQNLSTATPPWVKKYVFAIIILGPKPDFAGQNTRQNTMLWAWVGT